MNKDIKFNKVLDARSTYIFVTLNFDFEYRPFELKNYTPTFIINTKTGLEKLFDVQTK